MKKTFLLLLTLLAASSSIFAMSLDQQIQPQGDDNFTEARFRLWLPEKIQQVRGIFVLVPGSERDGLNLIDEPRWQQLATKWNFGLLGCTLRDYKGNYYLADKGTGRALLEALEKLSVAAKHPEIKDAPLAMWGHSAGGQFSYNFTSWLPERVIGFVAVKGAYYDAATDARSRNVPALFFIGETDEVIRIKNITEVFKKNRSQGAVWCLAVEPNEGHGVGKTLDFALAFFDALIPLRLDTKRSRVLRSLDHLPAWLGNLSSYEIAAASAYPQPATEAAWLPNETTARKWKEFVSRKDVAKTVATTAGPPPTAATVPMVATMDKMTPALIALVPGIIAAILFLSLRSRKQRSSSTS